MTLREIAGLLESSEPTPGVKRNRGVEDRVLCFRGRRYRIILLEGEMPDLGDVWYVKHFKPY